MTFFTQKEMRLTSQPLCERCGLFRHCVTPKIAIQGSGERRILFVGDQITESEDAKGQLFSGKCGDEIKKVLFHQGYDLNTDAWTTSALRCSGRPTPDQVAYCRPYVLQAIEQLNPDVIILIGYPAMLSVLGHLWKPEIGPVEKWHGFQIPSRELNAWVCPLLSPRHFNQDDSLVSGVFSRALLSAYELVGSPYPDGIPEINTKVYPDPKDAISSLEKFVEDGGPIALDYETNCLKPDSKDAEIITCGVCWRDRETIAFPFCPSTARLVSMLLKNNPVIGANIKFEDRWTRAKLGHPIANPVWDTVLAAHILDNRKGISSVKFQAFVQLGFPTYDSVSSFFTAKYGNEINRIKDAPFNELLKYNALDCILEYRIAKKQKRLMYN